MLCEPAAAVPCVPYVPWDIAMSRSSRPVAARAVRVMVRVAVCKRR